MLKIKMFILILSVILLIVSFVFQDKKGAVVAYLRVKNEIKTIEACLESIDGVFDRIVIIHSNEKDDGSVAFMNKWCQEKNNLYSNAKKLLNKHSYCEIYEYPYAVIPSHHKKYRGKVPFENTLAAYNNFGLQFFDPEDWVVKIDADQVYLTEQLKQQVEFVREKGDPNIKYGLLGYNTFSWNNIFVKFKRVPFNGRSGDSYFIKRKHFKKFVHVGNYEGLQFYKNMNKHVLKTPVWFHFMKSLKSNGTIRDKDKVSQDEISFLTQEEADLFNTHIRPHLKNSPYYHLKLEKE